MRSKGEELHDCPTCQRPLDDETRAGLGARDYAWLKLPNRLGMTDIDGYIDQDSTGRALAVEFKPSMFIPKGQRITLRNLVKHHGIDVWIVVENADKCGRLKLGRMDTTGKVNWTPQLMTLTTLNRLVVDWWEEGLV